MQNVIDTLKSGDKSKIAELDNLTEDQMCVISTYWSVQIRRNDQQGVEFNRMLWKFMKDNWNSKFMQNMYKYILQNNKSYDTPKWREDAALIERVGVI